MEFNIVDELLGITLLGSEWVLWLLLILSVVSVAIIFERLVFFRKIRIDFREFSGQLTQKLLADDIDGAKAICYQSPALECQVLLRGFEYHKQGVDSMDQSMSSYLSGERQTLDHGLVVLGTLGNNAPFIGLFGTVIGIIQAFNDLANNPAGGPSVVMAGISEALVATAVGLLVAIPAVIAYNGFQRVVKRHLNNAEACRQLVVAHYSKNG